MGVCLREHSIGRWGILTCTMAVVYAESVFVICYQGAFPRLIITVLEYSLRTRQHSIG